MNGRPVFPRTIYPDSRNLPLVIDNATTAVTRITEIAATAFPLIDLTMTWSISETHWAVRANVAPRQEIDVIDGIREWANALNGELFLHPSYETAAGSGVWIRKLTAYCWIGEVQVAINGSIDTRFGPTLAQASTADTMRAGRLVPRQGAR